MHTDIDEIEDNAVLAATAVFDAVIARALELQNQKLPDQMTCPDCASAVEELLAAAGPLPNDVAVAVEKLLDVVEVLAAQQQSLAEEVKRLRKKLEKKKNGKTTTTRSTVVQRPPRFTIRSSARSIRRRCLPMPFAWKMRS